MFPSRWEAEEIWIQPLPFGLHPSASDVTSGLHRPVLIVLRADNVLAIHDANDGRVLRSVHLGGLVRFVDLSCDASTGRIVLKSRRSAPARMCCNSASRRLEEKERDP